MIIIEEEGDLAKLRNQGAKRASGKYLIFIDDDVICSAKWLESIIECFSRYESIGGVSGPSTILHEYRRNRDLFRYPFAKWLYNLIFLEGRAFLPGHITKSGAWTTGAADEKCSYEGPVDFLEACNMAFKRSAFEEVGGFDEGYIGVGDWSEPDLAFRVRKAGYQLWFTQGAKLCHYPSKSGAFKKRNLDSKNRLQNYLRFASRHVPSHWRNELYKLFLRSYYAFKSAQQ